MVDSPDTPPKNSTVVESEDPYRTPTHSREAVSVADAPGTPSGPLDDLFYEKLAHGFAVLKSKEQSGQSDEEVVAPTEEQQIHNCAVVNFVDPSSSATTLVTASGAPAKAPLKLYQRMETIFLRDYGSKLTYVQHKHFRSGALGVIDTLNVRPILTSGGLMSLKQDVPWDATVIGGAPPDRTDPTEFHNAPYCHVYLASCESIEQYRNQVKPSVKAFVSQLEASAEEVSKSVSAAESNVLKKDGQSQYLIVFIPTGNNKDEVVGAASRVGAAFSRLRARGNSGKAADMTANASGHNREIDFSDLNSEADSEDGTSAAVQGHLSKVDKEITRRFSVDFPHAKLCTLSTLFDEKTDTEFDERQKLEWSAFMKALGAAITDGFTERCRRHDDCLRKLDAARTKAPGSSSEFDLKHYFLVKESFALTYEQMQLASEALLQYNELRALLPDVKSQEIQKDHLNLMWNEANSDSSFRRNALVGEPRRFRRHLRDLDNVVSVAPVLEQYLYSRETELLFKIGKPVEVLSRAVSFVESMFLFKMKFASAADSETSALRTISAEKWALDFCWDFRRASSSYFNFQTGTTETPEAVELQICFARELSRLLDFARLRYLSLGELSLGSENPLKGDSPRMPESVAWVPYKAPKEAVAFPAVDVVDNSLSPNFTDEAISSGLTYLEHYLSLAKSVAAACEFCNRKRTAAYRRLEVAEVCLRLGRKAQAAKALKSISMAFSKNRWDDASFLFRFRLAGLQRNLVPPQDYLSILILSFSSVSSNVAPKRALSALQQDFQAVVELTKTASPQFKHLTLCSPAFRSFMSIEGVTSKHVSNNEEFRRKLLNIGGDVTIKLKMTSHFPGDVPVDYVALDLVSFKKYMSAKEDDMALTRKDTYKVLELSPCVLRPGENDLEFKWHPMEPETLIVSSISVQMNGVGFLYPARKMRHATLRVDILPCEATQTIDIHPSSLISGQTQEVKIRLESQSDFIRKGRLDIVGLGGLVVSSNQDEKWKPNHEIELGECKPGSYLEHILTVCVPPPDESSPDISPPSLHVKSSTSFEFAADEETRNDERVAQIDHSEDVSIMATGTSTFALERSEFSLFSSTGSMLSLLIVSKAKKPLTLQGWEIQLPSCLKLLDNGDVNESFAGSAITDGGHIGMCFICESIDTPDDTNAPATLIMEFVDEHGSKFSESLRVDLEDFDTSPRPSSGTADVVATVSPLVSEGVSAFPVSLRYTLQASSVSGFEGNLSYSIETEHQDWLISGKSEGPIDNTSGEEWHVDIDAIPCRPGQLTSFPRLFLLHWQSAADTSCTGKPIPTQQDKKACFHSTAPEKQVSVACPTQAQKMYAV